MTRRRSNSPRWDDIDHGTDTPEQHAERMRLADDANASLRAVIADDDLRRAAEAVIDAYRFNSDDRTTAQAMDALRAALAARSDITQAATGGPDFTPKEWPEARSEPRAEGLTLVPDHVWRYQQGNVHLAGCCVHPGVALAATPPAEGLRDVAASAIALAGLLNDNMKAREMLPYYTGIADKLLPELRAALAPEQPE